MRISVIICTHNPRADYLRRTLDALQAQTLSKEGSLVTIDAMGFQTKIAHKIIDGGGDYILNVKGDQPTLRDGIEQVFASHLDEMPSPYAVQSSTTQRKAHERTESR